MHMQDYKYIISIEISLDNGHVIKKDYAVANDKQEAKDVAKFPHKELANFIYNDDNAPLTFDFVTPYEKEIIIIPMAKIDHISTKINENFIEM